MADNTIYDISTFIKTLRLNQTKAEKIIWSLLRNKNIGHKFRRQHKIGDCYNQEADAVRNNFLEKEGFKILRFWNNDVIENSKGVFQTIHETLQNS